VNPDKLALNRLEDLARQADQHDYPTHTGFLTPAEQAEAGAFLRARKIAHVLLGAMRALNGACACFYPRDGLLLRLKQKHS
jgi:RNA-binding protein YlmH